MSTNSTPSTAAAPADPRPVRRTLYLYITPGSALDRINNLSGDRELGKSIASMLDRYLAILHRASPKFSDRELCAIIDALSDNWEATPGNIHNLPREVMAAVTADRLNAKWEIDSGALRRRLDHTTFPERVKLAEMATAYWQLATPSSYPQDVIAQLQDLIRSTDTRPTETQRPRRVSHEAFDRGTTRTPHTGTDTGTGTDNPDAGPKIHADEDHAPGDDDGPGQEDQTTSAGEPAGPTPDGNAGVTHADDSNRHDGTPYDNPEAHSPAATDQALAEDTLL